MRKNLVKLIDFDVHGDERGSLIALEGHSDQVPFEIKRVYYIFGTAPHVIRGKHAHYDLKQILVCTSGQCDIDVFDGTTRRTIHLCEPNKGLLIDGFVWREMKNFSPDCVLMVLANGHYDEKDYIRNYKQFLEEVGK